MLLVVFLTAIVGYFIGSVPTGYLVARARGVDIRSMGSGNIGATNVFRILGRAAGIFVLGVDALKGYSGCVAWMLVVRLGIQPTPAEEDLQILRIAGSLGAILGHNYTCWLGFKGGKGIATSAGALIGLLPSPFLAILLVWLVVFALSRYVSLASIAAAAALPVFTWYFDRTTLMICIATAMASLAIYKHRANIGRLRNGTEHRVGGPRREPAR